MTRIQIANGTPRLRRIDPLPMCMWGDIPALGWSIPLRPEAVASCRREDPSGRIIVSFPYDPFLVSKVKAIEGRRWHSAGKHWRFPKLDGMLELLGHTDSKKTEIYTHVSTESLGKIRRRLDNLDLGEGEIDKM